VYRSSQSFRHLIAALLATLAIVAIVVLGVPRGEITPPDEIDVAAEAEQMSDAYDRTIVAPAVPADWRVNSARIEGDDVPAWTIVYVPDAESYLRVAQAFEPDAAWVSRTLSGATPSDTVTIDGITWDEFEIAHPEDAGNVSYALTTTAGADQLLLYGTADAKTTAVAAASLTDQIRALREETP
jgi:hypothetical protein